MMKQFTCLKTFAFLSLSIISHLTFAQPGASVVKKVIVPASMKTDPFNVERTVLLPPNFELSVFARIPGARFMAVAPNGDVLVSNPGAGTIKIIRTATNGAINVSDFVTGLSKPHDMVFHKIDAITYLYIAEQNQINRYIYTNGDLTAKNREIVVANLPSEISPELRGAYGHTLKNIAIDGNHKLYVSIASTCNACTEDTKSNPLRAAIYVYNANGTNGRLFAQGLRNAEGLDFIPGTNILWVCVNNRDNIAYPINDNTGNYGKVIQSYVDNHPVDEFTQVVDGGNYGWPFCNPDDRNGLDDMPFFNDYDLNRDGAVTNCATKNRISKGIQAHSAPIGFSFLQNTAMPNLYKNGAAIALRGSWNRTVKTGYKVIYFPWDATLQKPGKQIDLVKGFLNADSSSSYARPVDVAVTSQGDMLISDDQGGTIFKLTYKDPTVTGFDEKKSTESNTIIFPQPASKVLNVKVLASRTKLRLSISNMQGIEMLAKDFSASNVEHEISLETHTLTPGTYILTIQKDDSKETHKVVIE